MSDSIDRSSFHIPGANTSLNQLDKTGAQQVKARATEFREETAKGYIIATIANNILTTQVFENTFKGWLNYAISYLSSVLSDARVFTDKEALHAIDNALKIMDLTRQVLSPSSKSDESEQATQANRQRLFANYQTAVSVAKEIDWGNPEEVRRSEPQLKELLIDTRNSASEIFRQKAKESVSKAITTLCSDVEHKLAEACKGGSQQAISKAYKEAYTIWEKFEPGSDWAREFNKVETATKMTYPGRAVAQLKDQLVAALDVPRTRAVKERNDANSLLDKLSAAAHHSLVDQLLDPNQPTKGFLSTNEFAEMRRLAKFTRRLIDYTVLKDEEAAGIAHKALKEAKPDIGKGKWSDWKTRKAAYGNPVRLEAIKAQERSDFNTLAGKVDLEIQSLGKLVDMLNSVAKQASSGKRLAEVAKDLLNARQAILHEKNPSEKAQLNREIHLLQLIQAGRQDPQALKDQAAQLLDLFTAALPVVTDMAKNGLPTPMGTAQIQEGFTRVKGFVDKAKASFQQAPPSSVVLEGQLKAIQDQLNSIPKGYG